MSEEEEAYRSPNAESEFQCVSMTRNNMWGVDLGTWIPRGITPRLAVRYRLKIMVTMMFGIN
jgi:hypothetical protein